MEIDGLRDPLENVREYIKGDKQIPNFDFMGGQEGLIKNSNFLKKMWHY